MAFPGDLVANGMDNARASDERPERGLETDGKS